MDLQRARRGGLLKHRVWAGQAEIHFIWLVILAGTSDAVASPWRIMGFCGLPCDVLLIHCGRIEGGNLECSALQVGNIYPWGQACPLLVPSKHARRFPVFQWQRDARALIAPLTDCLADCKGGLLPSLISFLSKTREPRSHLTKF